LIPENCSGNPWESRRLGYEGMTCRFEPRVMNTTLRVRTLLLLCSVVLGCAEPPDEPSARPSAKEEKPAPALSFGGQVPAEVGEPAPVVTSSQGRSGYVLGDPEGWRQETWWTYHGRHEGLFVVSYSIGDQLWGSTTLPSPFERSWTLPRPPQGWLEDRCRERACTRQIQGPARVKEGGTLSFSAEDVQPTLRAREEVLADLYRIGGLDPTEVEAWEGILVASATAAGHARLRAWIRPQLCALRHPGR
jgi:hypothetical protein